MNPPFCFDTANIEQKSDSANFFVKKMQKMLKFLHFLYFLAFLRSKSPFFSPDHRLNSALKKNQNCMFLAKNFHIIANNRLHNAQIYSYDYDKILFSIPNSPSYPSLLINKTSHQPLNPPHTHLHFSKQWGCHDNAGHPHKYYIRYITTPSRVRGGT